MGRSPFNDDSRPGAPSLQDIADRAGVSLATASRVLGSGSRRVGPAMVDRVTRAAAELGYSANLPARTVATGRSNTIGVVVHDVSDPYFSTIATAIVQTAGRHAALVSLANAYADPVRERTYIGLMRSMRARAVIVVGSRTDDRDGQQALRAELDAFQRGRGRAVCIGQPLLGADTVAPENAAGAHALAASLAAVGHQSFAVLGGPPWLHTAQDRVRGFRTGLRAAGIELEERAVVPGEFTRDGGYAAMSTLLARAEPLPDCLFAVNDLMALGALARLRAAGIEVPDRVAVAGFDDIVTLRDVTPPLTTVRLPLESMGELAVQLALEHDASDAPRVLPVPGEVILRESSSLPVLRAR